MARQVQINLNLNPVVTYDTKTKEYVIYYEEFPQAIATGSSKDEAEDNLIFLVEQMWQKRSDDLKKFLLDNYIQNIQINSSPSANSKGAL